MQRFFLRAFGLSLFILLSSGCAGLFKKSEPPQETGKLSNAKPNLKQPTGPSLGELMELFVDPSAPPLSNFDQCDKKYFDFTKKNNTSVKTPEEIAMDLVRYHREEMHWCFYVRLLDIANPLSVSDDPKIREKQFVEAFRFLTPTSKAYQTEYNDISYMVMAAIQYRELSERYFGRRVEMTPEVTSSIVESWKKKRLELEQLREDKK